jgi:hypothetical protein
MPCRQIKRKEMKRREIILCGQERVQAQALGLLGFEANYTVSVSWEKIK